MGITHLKTGKYRVSVAIGHDFHGKKIIKTKTVDTLRDAHVYEARFLAMKAKGRSRVMNVDFGTYVTYIFSQRLQARVRESTWHAYKVIIYKHLMPYFRTYPMSKITRREIQKLIDTRKTPSIAKKTYQVLRLIFNEAISDGYIKKNPCNAQYIFPRHISEPPSKQKKWLVTFAEHKEIIRKMPYNRMGALVVLGLSSGLRKGELLALQWCDVDFEEKTVSVRQTITEFAKAPMPPKTRLSERTIPVPSYAFEWLSIYRLEYPGEDRDYVFPGTNTPWMNSAAAARHMREYFDKHPELPRLTIHNLRHSFATSCINAGIQVEVVSRWLGHSSIITTYNRYIKPRQDQLHAAVSDIERAFNA